MLRPGFVLLSSHGTLELCQPINFMLLVCVCVLQIKMLQSIVSVLSAVKTRCMRVQGFSIDARPLYKMLIAKTLGPEEGYDMHGFAGAIDRTLRTVFPQVRATAGTMPHPTCTSPI